MVNCAMKNETARIPGILYKAGTVKHAMKNETAKNYLFWPRG